MHASVKYTKMLFAGSDKFPTKEVVGGVQAAAAEGVSTRDTVRMWFYADDQLENTGELLKVSHQMRTRASTTSGASRLSSGLQRGDEFVVKVAWERLEEA